MATRTTEIGPWDLSQERVFIENLLCQRFDFFLVFYSLVIVAAFTVSEPVNFVAIFVMGTAVCSLLATSIVRTHNKLEIILREIRKGDECRSDGRLHPATWSDDQAEAFAKRAPLRSLFGSSGREIVGYRIPVVCAVSLWLAAAFALIGFLKPG